MHSFLTYKQWLNVKVLLMPPWLLPVYGSQTSKKELLLFSGGILSKTVTIKHYMFGCGKMLEASSSCRIGLSWWLLGDGMATTDSSSTLWSSLVAWDCGYARVAWYIPCIFWLVSSETDWGFSKIPSLTHFFFPL